MNRNKIKELVPEGTRDVSGNLVDIDEVNMDYGGYRMKVKAGGSIGDFYGYKQINIFPYDESNAFTPDTW